MNSGGDLAAGVVERATDRLHVGAEDRRAVVAAPCVRVGDGARASPGSAASRSARTARSSGASPRGWPTRGRGRARRRSRPGSARPAARSPSITVSGVPTSVVPCRDALAQRILVPPGRPAERVLEVGDRLVTLARVHLAERQLVVLGHVHVDHEPPLARGPSSCRAGRPSPRRSSTAAAMASGPPGKPGAERQHAEPLLAGRDHAGRRDHARHRDGKVRIRVRRQMQPRLAQLEPVGLHRHRPIAARAAP